jgi:hypothetical protein
LPALASHPVKTAEREAWPFFFSSLLKNGSSHRRKPVSRKRASSKSTPYWMPAFAGMTESSSPGQFSTNC